MLRNAYLVFGILVCTTIGWARWTGHEFGDDATTVWSQQGANQYQHHK